MGAVAEAAKVYAGAGYMVIIEGIVIPRWFLGPLSETLEAAGHGVAYAVLRAPLELCRQRVAARGAESLSGGGALEGIWEQFQDLGPWERHAIDAASPDVQAVVAELERRLEEGELLSP